MVEPREFNELDAKMFFVMDALKSMSKCRDKQVVCIIVDRDTEIIRSVGVNRVTKCDRNCHDKINRVCQVSHAEIEAVASLSEHGAKGHLIAYVNLFPCAPCQRVLDPYVAEIVTFGMVHKDWNSDKILVFPHPYYGKYAETVAEDSNEAVDSVVAAATDIAHQCMTTALQDKYPEFRTLTNEARYFMLKTAMENGEGRKLIAYTKATYTTQRA